MRKVRPTQLPSWREEIASTLRLALPLTAVQLSLVALGLVDTACLGRASTVDLAGLTMGNAIVFTVMVVGFGVGMALEPLSSQAVGAREHHRAWQWWRTVLRVCLLLAIPLMAVAVAITYTLTWFGVAADVQASAVEYAWARSPSILFQLVFVAGRSYLQSYEETWSVLLAALLANILNYVMNMLFIYGDETLLAVGLPAVGLPRLGAAGVGIATTGASIFMAAVVYYRVWRRAPTVTTAAPKNDLLQVLRMGLPLGMQLAAEVGIFAMVAVMAGRLGKEVASAHQIAIGLASATFMATLGLSAAASVRVGHAIGRGDTPAARRAGLFAVGIGLAIMSAGAVIFITLPGPLTYIFTDNPAVRSLAVELLFVAAVFQLFDGLQAVFSGALRGAGDIRVPFIANVACHWGIGLPVALFLGFTLEWGAVGLWYGLTAGLSAIGLTLGARFLLLTRRTISRT